ALLRFPAPAGAGFTLAAARDVPAEMRWQWLSPGHVDERRTPICLVIYRPICHLICSWLGPAPTLNHTARWGAGFGTQVTIPAYSVSQCGAGGCRADFLVREKCHPLFSK